MNREEQAKKMQKVIAKAWMDEDFKQKLLAEPAEALQAEGIEPPHGVEIKALENTDNLFYFVLPAKPRALAAEGLDDRLAATALPIGMCDCY